MNGRKKPSVTLPSIIRESRGKVEIEVPDFNVKVDGRNYTEAMGRTIETVTAICNYRVERNIPIRITETYDSLTEKTSKEKGKHFIYMLSPVHDY